MVCGLVRKAEQFTAILETPTEQGGLGLTVAGQKTQALSNNQKRFKQLRIMPGERCGQIKRHVKKLGNCYTFDMKPCLETSNARHQQVGVHNNIL